MKSTDMVQRAIDRAMGKVRSAFRTVLTAIDSEAPIQLVQADGLAGEQLQDNELMQQYGFTSVPLAGTQMIVLPIGGKTAHGVVIASEHIASRIKNLKSGEVAIYDDQGQSVFLTRQGIVVNGGGLPVMVTNTPSVQIDSPTVTMTGDLTVDGAISANGNISTQADMSAAGDIKDQGGAKSMSGMRAAYNAHKHGASPLTDKAM